MIEEYLRERAARIEGALAAVAFPPGAPVEPRLREAMEYSLLSPGKRIRADLFPSTASP